jgi:Predicted membrane protein (DUF2157)
VFGAAIALVGQMYHLGDDFAAGMLLWAAGALAAAALTGSRGALAVALVAGCIWSGARSKRSDCRGGGITATPYRTEGDRRRAGYANQMQRINAQVQDLRDIFAEQLFVHPDFRGSTSIKAVMPVLVPELSYDGLSIKEGATASEQWWKMTAEDTPAGERERIARALREYCGLDSYAMYAIWGALRRGS